MIPTDAILSEADGIPEPEGLSPTERLARRLEMRVPASHNPKLQRALEWVNGNDELYGLWIASNVNAIDRLGMTDHGPVHVKIVMNLAVRLLRLLMEGGVEPDVVRAYGLERDDAEVIVTLAALFHDLGISIHRNDHESYSLFLAQDLLKELLPRLYGDAVTRAVVRSEVLHAIIGHRSDGRPLTLEAGVVRIADALDMAKGRSRIPFEAGSVSIHSVSAAAVDRVVLGPGESKPVRIVIELTNSAGVFQIDQLLREKLKHSRLEGHLEVEAVLVGEDEARLFRRFQL
jgi:metal-dependent HD superfamily phosphatase/phosphodiesterase